MNETEKEQKTKWLNAMFQFRHATKSFDPDRKITPKDFEFILEAARWAPSSFGLEPWNLVVIQNSQIRQELLSVVWGAQRQLPTASHFVALLVRRASEFEPDADYFNHMLRDIRHLPNDIQPETKKRMRLFLDDDFAVLSDDLFREWNARQAYLALGNMLNTAAALEIDSCAIEGFHREKTEALLVGHGLIDRTRFSLACFAAFGFRDATPRPKSRRPLEEIVAWA